MFMVVSEFASGRQEGFRAGPDLEESDCGLPGGRSLRGREVEVDAEHGYLVPMGIHRRNVHLAADQVSGRKILSQG